MVAEIEIKAAIHNFNTKPFEALVVKSCFMEVVTSFYNLQLTANLLIYY